MKKIAIILLAAAIISCFAGCGKRPAAEPAPKEGPEQVNVGEDAPDKAENTPEPSENRGKALVVYFSATGSTRAAAEYVAAAVGADTFELVPTTPYTAEDLNWTNSESRVSREHEDEQLRAVELTTLTPEGWEEYDTVFIGYPIWWGIAAWPVNSFVTGNDFSGKTVIPFCTSASSGLGSSGTLLAEAAGTGDWLEGRRFSSGVAEAEITAWIDELNLG